MALRIGIFTLDLCYFDVPHPLKCCIGSVEGKGLEFAQKNHTFALESLFRPFVCFKLTNVAVAPEVLPTSTYTLVERGCYEWNYFSCKLGRNLPTVIICIESTDDRNNLRCGCLYKKGMELEN